MDAVLQLAETLLASPWLYALVLVLAGLDGLFPVVPAETVVLTAAAYAVGGEPSAVALLGAAWAGALIGDVTAHHLGRRAGPLARRLRRGRGSGRFVAWAQEELRTRGGMLIISARFIPGGRTATAIASGMVGYPRPRFVGFAALAALLWGLYTIGIGMLGGLAFREQPLLGVAVGIGLALLVGAAIELVKALKGRRRREHLSRHMRADSDSYLAPSAGG